MNQSAKPKNRGTFKELGKIPNGITKNGKKGYNKVELLIIPETKPEAVIVKAQRRQTENRSRVN